IGNPVIRLDTALLRSDNQSRTLSARYWNDARLEAEMSAAARAGDAALRRKLSFEYHWRRALSATCVVFLLLGLPTGLSSRRGNQLLPQAMAIGLALLYYVLFMQATRQLVSRTWVAEREAAWAVTLAFLLLGAWWTRKVLRR
ncbi:MAG: Lipopolysaccharide export system permease LptF/LptG, partial [Planctomycetota bacterium]